MKDKKRILNRLAKNGEFLTIHNENTDEYSFVITGRLIKNGGEYSIDNGSAKISFYNCLMIWPPNEKSILYHIWL